MATTRRQTKSRAKKRPGTTLSAASSRVLRDWRGCDEPLDLKKGVHRASDFLEEVMNAAGASTGIQEEKLRLAWKEIAGNFISSHTEPVSVRQGELLLRVSQPALRFQLERMKPELLARIHQTFGTAIQAIRFTHG